MTASEAALAAAAPAPVRLEHVVVELGGRRVLEDVTLADVVAGRLPEHVTELVALEDAWRSGDVPTR
jgi:hypothetical protein